MTTADIEAIRACLYTGQKSKVKAEAQAAFARLENLLQRVRWHAVNTPEAGSLRVALREFGFISIDTEEEARGRKVDPAHR